MQVSRDTQLDIERAVGGERSGREVGLRQRHEVRHGSLDAQLERLVRRLAGDRARQPRPCALADADDGGCGRHAAGRQRERGRRVEDHPCVGDLDLQLAQVGLDSAFNQTAQCAA